MAKVVEAFLVIVMVVSSLFAVDSSYSAQAREGAIKGNITFGYLQSLYYLTEPPKPAPAEFKLPSLYVYGKQSQTVKISSWQVIQGCITISSFAMKEAKAPMNSRLC